MFVRVFKYILFVYVYIYIIFAFVYHLVYYYTTSNTSVVKILFLIIFYFQNVLLIFNKSVLNLTYILPCCVFNRKRLNVLICLLWVEETARDFDKRRKNIGTLDTEISVVLELKEKNVKATLDTIHTLSTTKESPTTWREVLIFLVSTTRYATGTCCTLLYAISYTLSTYEIFRDGLNMKICSAILYPVVFRLSVKKIQIGQLILVRYYYYHV